MVCPVRPGRFRAIGLLLLLVLGLCAPAEVLAGEGPMLRRARERFEAVLGDEKRAASRKEWRRTAQDFEAVLAVNQKGPSAPRALFYLGRVHEELGRRFNAKADLAKAETWYSKALARFPDHEAAPDCLLHRAEVRKLLGKTAPAREDLETILAKWKKSEAKSKAKALLAELDRPAARKPEPKTEPKSEARKKIEEEREAEPHKGERSSPGPATAGGGQLTEVRYTSSDDYTRVVLELSVETKYRYQLLDPMPDKERPHRLYVDMPGTKVARTVQPNVQVADGILRNIRSSQKDAETARVVLDFHELQDYKIFYLSNPFRIVIDVFAPQAEAKPKVKEREVVEEEPPLPVPLTPKEKLARRKAQKLSPKERKKVAEGLLEQLGLTVHTIMLDPGHGGHDPGARGNGIVEKDLNLKFAKLLGGMLKEKCFRVLNTRSKDVFVPLEQRTAMANAQKADLFVSVHVNANPDPSVHGLETYNLNLARNQDAVRVAARENAVDPKHISDLQVILTDLMLHSKRKESADLAHDVQDRAVSRMRPKFNLGDHGVREAPFYVLMGAKMPSILVELGYLTNRAEAGRLRSEAYLNLLARGIVDGIMAYKRNIERFAGKT